MAGFGRIPVVPHRHRHRPGSADRIGRFHHRRAGQCSYRDSDENIGEAFVTDTPNPQPSEPLTPAQDADSDAADASAATITDTASADAPETTTATEAATTTAAQNELAFTGPDTRIAALAFSLLGLGAAFTAAARRRD